MCVSFGGKPPQRHAHSKILQNDEGRRNVFNVGVAVNNFLSGRTTLSASAIFNRSISISASTAIMFD